MTSSLVSFIDGSNGPRPASNDKPLPVLSTNVAAAVQNGASAYPSDAVWDTPSLSGGDFIIQRGNTGGASWLELSKDPWTANGEMVLTLRPRLTMPARLTTLVSMSHRNAGEQIFSQEFVSDEAAYNAQLLPDPTPVEILNASQSTTTITVNFASAPATPFRVGQVVSIYGFVDTRLNVNSCTIASVVSPTQVTVVGNDYTLTSTTIGTTLGSGAAFIERVDMLGRARNGIAVVHGSGTATQRRVYVRADGALARPSGTLAGAHAITTGTDAATAAAGTTPYSESWTPPLETVFMCARDGFTLGDRTPDNNNAITGRLRVSQVTPDATRPYMLRFRVRATPSLTRPVAKIVSISKAGSTTATITTDGPHGLTTGQYVGFYGVRDQTNFANQTTGLVCTVLTATTFTVVHGASATATSYGGFVMRVQGQQPLGGAITQVAQSVSRTSNVVTLTGSATWAGLAVVGNIIDLIGVRDNVSGADLGLDGSYVIRNLATTTLTLEPVTGVGPTGADIGATNCGGGVVARLGVRIHGVLVSDYNPMLMEHASKGLADASETLPVAIVSSAALSVTNTVLVQGAQANNATTVPQPVLTSIVGVSANPTAGTTARQQQAIGTLIGVPITKPYAIPEAAWNANLALTSTTAQALAAAAGAGLKRHITALQTINTGASAVDVLILDGATERWRMTLPVNVPVVIPFPTELLTTANTALNVNLSAAGTVQFCAQGYTAP